MHSTDIFEQIISLEKKIIIKDFNINFKKKIINQPFIEFFNKSKPSKYEKSFVNFSYKIKNYYKFGYIFQKKNKIKKNRVYNERQFQKKVKLKKKTILVPFDRDFNFIESITSSSMKHLKFFSPEKKNKWYLIKIYLKAFSKKNDYKNIKLIVEKKSEKLNLINIVLKNNKIGQMIFLKK